SAPSASQAQLEARTERSRPSRIEPGASRVSVALCIEPGPRRAGARRRPRAWRHGHGVRSGILAAGKSRQSAAMKLIIQIPCFNEADQLPKTLADLPRE